MRLGFGEPEVHRPATRLVDPRDRQGALSGDCRGPKRLMEWQVNAKQQFLAASMHWRFVTAFN